MGTKLSSKSKGRKVILGVRPEHIMVKPDTNTTPINIDLDLIETLGSEALLHCMMMEKPFVVKAETNGDVSQLEGLNAFHFKPDMIKVFDGETGNVFDHPERLK